MSALFSKINTMAFGHRFTYWFTCHVLYPQFKNAIVTDGITHVFASHYF